MPSVKVISCETVKEWLGHLLRELETGGVPYCLDKGDQLVFQADFNQYLLDESAVKIPDEGGTSDLGLSTEGLRSLLTRGDQRRAWFDKWSQARQVDTFQEYMQMVVARQRRDHVLLSTDDPVMRTLGFTDRGIQERGLLPEDHWTQQTVAISLSAYRRTKTHFDIPGVDGDAVREMMRNPMGRGRVLVSLLTLEKTS